MGLETVIFGKKTVSDVLKEVYDNSKRKETQINALIGELKPLVKEIGDESVPVCCQTIMTRVWSAIPAIFKTGGFYKTGG